VPYTKQSWEDGNGLYPGSAARFLHMENGIALGYPEANVKDEAFSGGAKGDGATDDTAALQAAINSGPGIKLMPAGTYLFSKLKMADNVVLLGVAKEAVAFVCTQTTERAVDYSGIEGTGLTDMTVFNATKRTANAFFYLDHGGSTCQQNRFERLQVSSPYIGWQLNNCSTTTFEDILFNDLNSSWAYFAGIWLSGTATSTVAINIRGGTGATMEKALIYTSGAGVDSLDLVALNILGLAPTLQMAGLLFESGQWIRVEGEIESGTTAVAMEVNGAHSVTGTAMHLLGKKGLVVKSGNCVTLNGGEILECMEGGVDLNGGEHHKILNMNMTNISNKKTKIHSGVNVAAGVSNFTITGNTIGKALSGTFGNTEPLHGVNIAVGASDHYIVTGNNIKSSGTPVEDGGSGANKVTTGNIV
jgi:hypothetical protein